MSAILQSKQDAIRQQMVAAKGAGIVLVNGCGEYVAQLAYALRCAEILGSRELEDVGDGIYESIQRYRIPYAEMNDALAKLSARYSVALVEYAQDKHGGRFVLVHRINPVNFTPKPAINLDEY